MRHQPAWSSALALASWITVGLGACGGDVGQTGDTVSDTTGEAITDTDASIDPNGDPVAVTLTKLNVDLSITPRVDGDDKPLPDDFAPLGSSRILARKTEIFLAGMARAGGTEVVSLLKFYPGVSDVPGVPNVDDDARPLPSSPLDSTWKVSPVNAAAPCDIDGDGLEEIVLAWWSTSDPAVRVAVIDDATADFAASSGDVVDTPASLSWIALACGDFDGDGDGDVALAMVDDASGSARVALVGGSVASGFALDPALDVTSSATHSGSRLDVRMSAGQLDRDAGLELGVMVNEVWGSGTNQAPADGRSDYYLYDDRSAAFALMRSGRFSAEVDAKTHDGLTGAIALGDIDGDGLDEVVLAALADEFPVGCAPIQRIQLALDDATQGFASLGAHFAITQRNDQGSGCESSGNNGHIERVWAGTLDIDGDQLAEIQVDGEVYEDFVNAAAPWDPLLVDVGGDGPVPAHIPNAYLYKSGSGNNQWAQTTRANTAMAVGDVTADGRDDILVYAPGPVQIGTRTSGGSTTGVYAYAVTVWGIDPLTGQWGKDGLPADGERTGMLYYEELRQPGDAAPTGGPPLVVPVNVDKDSVALEFSPGSHRLVFSEPIVHAALAAPPCYDDGSQVSEDCRTSWGIGTTTGVEASISHEISVRHHTGVTGGVSLPVIGEVGVEVENSVGVSLRFEASLGYQVAHTVTYTTGPMEDTVIATVIPYDQYTYEILSHPLYPELVGKDLVISLPRTPRTMQISRQFYNDAVSGEGQPIDTGVFEHTIGDPKSYPSRSDMLARANAVRLGPQDVGASAGNQTVTISESIVAGFTATIGLSFETSVKATAGKVMEGYSVSNTTEASLGFSVGSQVTFTGTVGDMPPATFSLDKAYSFGMFAYKQSAGDGQREFQVVNYWVE